MSYQTKYRLLDDKNAIILDLSKSPQSCFSGVRESSEFNHSVKAATSIELVLPLPDDCYAGSGSTCISDEQLSKALKILGNTSLYKDRLSLYVQADGRRVIKFVLPEKVKGNYNNFLVAICYLRYLWENHIKGPTFWDLAIMIKEGLPKLKSDWLLLRVEPIFGRITGFNPNHMILYNYYLTKGTKLEEIIEAPNRSGSLNANMNTIKSFNPIYDSITWSTDKETLIKQFKEFYGIKKV